MDKIRLPIYVTEEQLKWIDTYVFKRKMRGDYWGNRPYSRTAFFDEAIELMKEKAAQEEKEENG